MSPWIRFGLLIKSNPRSRCLAFVQFYRQQSEKKNPSLRAVIKMFLSVTAGGAERKDFCIWPFWYRQIWRQRTWRHFFNQRPPRLVLRVRAVGLFENMAAILWFVGSWRGLAVVQRARISASLEAMAPLTNEGSILFRFQRTLIVADQFDSRSVQLQRESPATSTTGETTAAAGGQEAAKYRRCCHPTN